MAELPNQGQLGPRFTFKCNEGNVTIQTGSPVGGDVSIPVFASPIADGDWVKLTGDRLISKCAATDPETIGQVVGTPSWWNTKQPTANKTWGNYEPRRVTVECMCKAIRTVQLEAANTEVTYGMMVKLGATTAQRFDKATVENYTRVIVSGGASSGAKIPVMFGFYGNLTRT
jgi:hypothetical protein